MVVVSRGVLGASYEAFAPNAPNFKSFVSKTPHMALTNTIIRSAKPQEKDWKLADEKGLYLLITAVGSKLWRLNFRHLGNEKKLSLGADPGTIFNAEVLS